MKKRLFVLYTAAICLLIASCSNLGGGQNSFSEQDGAAERASADGKSYLSVRIADNDSRTALPSLTNKGEFDYIVLKGKKAGAESFDILGAWTSDFDDSGTVVTKSAYSKMSDASIELTAGDWDLYLRASKGGVNAYESSVQKISVANGVIKLVSFRLGVADIVMAGNGKIKVTLNYDNETEKRDIKRLCVLCEQDSGDAERATTMTKITFPAADNKYVFDTGSENVPAGVYRLTFLFYSDDAERKDDDASNWWTNCVGYWREYAIVAGGLESVSEKTIESVGSLYQIELKDGNATVTPKPASLPLTFTRNSDEIILPVSKGEYESIVATITEAVEKDPKIKEADRADEIEKRKKPYSYVEKTGYLFDGWYKNADFSGEPSTLIPAGTSENLTFYSKWLETVKVTYKDPAFATGEEVVEHVKGKNFKLLDSAYMDDIGKINNQIFLGWALSESAAIPDKGYESGADRVAEEDMTLNSVWADFANKTIPVVNNTVTDETKRAEYQAAIMKLCKDNNAFLTKNYGEWKDYVDTTDSDKDGLYDWEETYVAITSPWNRDSDGDGWDDRTELTMFNRQTNTFNPLISDLPKLIVTMTSVPYFTYTYTSTSGKSMSDSVTRTETGTFGHNSNTTTSNAYASAYELNVSGTASYTWAGPNPGWSASGTLGFKKTWTFTDTYSYSKGESETYSRAVANGKVNTTNESRTVTGGNVKVALKFSNPSDLAYTVNNVAVEAFRKQTSAFTGPDNSRKPIQLPLGSMKTGSSVAMTLQPHSESGIINYELSLTPQQFEDLMRNTSAFDVGVAGYSISIKDGQKRSSDFTDEYTNSAQLTTAVNIDYGPSYNRKTESYNVSVKFKPKMENTGATINVYDDLYLEDVLKICVGEGNFEIEDGKLVSVHGLKNAASKKDGAWYVDYFYTDDSGNPARKICGPDSAGDKDLDDITVAAKTMFSIFYDIDADRDGVPLRIEKASGSSDSSADTDKDGVSDKEEIFGWVPSEKITSTRYRTPSGTHSALLGSKIMTRPNSADTDGDDWPDGEDPNPIIPRDLTDSSLRSLAYTFGLSQKPKNVEKIPQASGGVATIASIKAVASDKIWIDPKPKLVSSTMKYAIKEALGNSEPAMPQESDYAAIPASGISLKRNKTYLYIKVTAPDKTTSTIYKLPVESPFKDMANVSCTTVPKDSYLNLDMAFDSYIDSRLPETQYIFAASTTKVPESLSDTDVANAIDISSAKPGKDFLLKVDKDKMKAGRFSVAGFIQKNAYKVALYAWSKNEDGFCCNRIFYKDPVNVGLARKGKVKVYLNWMRLAWDPNAFNSKPEYFWSFQMANKNGEVFNNGKLSELKEDLSMSLNMGRYNWVNFNDDQCRYGKKYQYDCTPKTFVYEFDQFEDQEIRMKKRIYYDTAAGANEPLVLSDTTFKYDKSTQIWTVRGECNHYASRDSRYVPGTDPFKTEPPKFQYPSYWTFVQVTTPGKKVDFETYHSKCSSDSPFRYEYGGVILNISLEWME